MKYADPIELVNSMQDIDYGIYDTESNKWVSMTESYKEFMKVINNGTIGVGMPSEVARSRMGSCWDCTLYAYTELCKIPDVYDIETFYLENLTQGDLLSTHTGIVYKTKYKRPKGYKEVWHWFEHAWCIYRGVNGPFLSRDECHARIQMLLKDYETDARVTQTNYIPNWDIDTFLKENKNRKFVSPDEFIAACRGRSYA